MQSLLFITLLFLTGNAWSNELCEKARIHSLKFFTINQRVADETCLKSLQDLNPIETRTLEQLADIHWSASQALKVDINDLFIMPLKVEIREYLLASIVSSAGPDRISMGVYPDDNFELNLSVYVHELGHILSTTPNPALPKQLVDLDRSSFFSETFSDMLALTLTDHIFTPSIKNPTCLDTLRFITNKQTYNYPQEYFQNFVEARIVKCCTSLLETNSDPKVRNLCQAALEWFEGDITFTTSFDPHTISGVDDHQIGIPMLSFLKNFSRETKVSFQNIFHSLFFSTNNPTSENYYCSLRKNDLTLLDVEESLHTVRALFHDFRTQLPESQQEVFEKLFAIHAIEKGLIYADRDTRKNLARETKDFLMKNWSDLKDHCEGGKACIVTCELKAEVKP